MTKVTFGQQVLLYFLANWYVVIFYTFIQVVANTINYKQSNLDKIGIIDMQGHDLKNVGLLQAKTISGVLQTPYQQNVSQVGRLQGDLNVNQYNINNVGLLDGIYINGTITTSDQPNVSVLGVFESDLDVNHQDIRAVNHIDANTLSGKLLTCHQPGINGIGKLHASLDMQNHSWNNVNTFEAKCLKGSYHGIVNHIGTQHKPLQVNNHKLIDVGGIKRTQSCIYKAHYIDNHWMITDRNVSFFPLQPCNVLKPGMYTISLVSKIYSDLIIGRNGDVIANSKNQTRVQYLGPCTPNDKFTFTCPPKTILTWEYVM